MGTVKTLPSYFSPISKQVLTVSSSAVGLTIPTTPQVRAILLTVEHTVSNTDTLRHWKTGDDPTTSEGQLLYSGDILEITNVSAISNLRLIASGNDMKVMVEYYGGGI